MLKPSSEYKISYFNITQLENRLNLTDLKKNLWIVKMSTLKSEFSKAIPNSEGMVLNFLKDKNETKTADGSTIYNGLFIVASKKELSESDMKTLLIGYKIDNPDIFQNNQIAHTNNYISNSISKINSNQNSQEIKKSDVSLYDTSSFEDLNEVSKNLEKDNLVFGVIDDINHLEHLSKLNGVEIIENFGDFGKIYFSIPSFRQDEALAYSVTILKQIKCKRSLMDYIS